MDLFSVLLNRPKVVTNKIFICLLFLYGQGKTCNFLLKVRENYREIKILVRENCKDFMKSQGNLKSKRCINPGIYEVASIPT